MKQLAVQKEEKTILTISFGNKVTDNFFSAFLPKRQKDPTVDLKKKNGNIISVCMSVYATQ